MQDGCELLNIKYIYLTLKKGKKVLLILLNCFELTAFLPNIFFSFVCLYFNTELDPSLHFSDQNN